MFCSNITDPDSGIFPTFTSYSICLPTFSPDGFVETQREYHKIAAVVVNMNFKKKYSRFSHNIKQSQIMFEKDIAHPISEFLAPYHIHPHRIKLLASYTYPIPYHIPVYSDYTPGIYIIHIYSI